MVNVNVCIQCLDPEKNWIAIYDNAETPGPQLGAEFGPPLATDEDPGHPEMPVGYREDPDSATDPFNVKLRRMAMAIAFRYARSRGWKPVDSVSFS